LVDTTGAGDTFTGGFAVGLLENNKDEKKAMELGS
jgi:sugar/nucleoside kinase (ribokinase family)